MVATVARRIDGFKCVIINFEYLTMFYVLNSASEVSFENMLAIESAKSFVDLREIILPY